MNSWKFWHILKGFIAGIVALIACPCHLPITFPLLVSLTAGTALGSWLEGHFGLVFGVSTVIFMVGLGLALYWNTRPEPAGGRAAPQRAAGHYPDRDFVHL